MGVTSCAPAPKTGFRLLKGEENDLFIFTSLLPSPESSTRETSKNLVGPMNAGSLSPLFWILPDIKSSGKQVFPYDRWAWIMKMLCKISQILHCFLQELSRSTRFRKFRSKALVAGRWKLVEETVTISFLRGWTLLVTWALCQLWEVRLFIKSFSLCHSHLNVLPDHREERHWKPAFFLVLPSCKNLLTVTKLIGLGWMQVKLMRL